MLVGLETRYKVDIAGRIPVLESSCEKVLRVWIAPVTIETDVPHHPRQDSVSTGIIETTGFLAIQKVKDNRCESG
jgi:hypothetical protein